MYAEHGYGPLKVVQKQNETVIGMAGLFKRAGLDHADIGFAFLTEHCGKGHGYEVSRAILLHCKSHLLFETVLSITSPANVACQRLLSKLGFERQGMTLLPGHSQECELYRWTSSTN